MRRKAIIINTVIEWKVDSKDVFSGGWKNLGRK